MSNPWQYPGPQPHPFDQRHPAQQHQQGHPAPQHPAPQHHQQTRPAHHYPQPAPVAVAPAGAARTPWIPLVGTATAAAVAASLLTAGATGAFDAEPAATGAVAEEAPASRTVPATLPGEQPDWQAVADDVRASVVAIQVRTAQGGGQGSGVVIDAEGRILTNHHVVGEAVEGGLQVGLADGRVLEATLVGTDPTRDVAVIQLVDTPEDLQPAELGDSEAVEVGAPVMAVGNPLGLDSTVTTGIVSALDRPVTTGDGGGTVVTNAIQIDAAINPGNSGGPLFDAQGRVIGINSSIASMPTGNGGSAGSIGLGFAIPSTLAERVAAELVEDGTASHAFLGVSLSDGTAETDGEVRRGAVIEEVTDGTPAAQAGLRAGDVVVAIDGDPVRGAESLTAFVRERAVGEDVSLTVARDGSTSAVDVTLVERPDLRAQEAPQQAPQQAPRGFDPGDLPPGLFGQG
ncbi:S1C family serine protease [Actinotalea sp. Marseille-Q4924]|uniref:S1C family serine protease n=1 Tax=Actinotalea sp. Marseille-Q4924 TaxID=2866571 RepID=UPI001CE47D7E|nr:trypsin-like peptidase domain-containing protein [Actinotalea sp. Marseille-Q4924]